MAQIGFGAIRLAGIGTVPIDHPDFPGSSLPLHPSNRTPVRRPGGRRVSAAIIETDLAQPSAISIHHIDFPIAIPVGRKNHLASIGRPICPIIRSWVFGQPHQSACPIRGDPVNFRVPIAIRGEDQFGCSLIQNWIDIRRRVVGQPTHLGSVGPQDENVPTLLRNRSHSNIRPALHRERLTIGSKVVRKWLTTCAIPLHFFSTLWV